MSEPVVEPGDSAEDRIHAGVARSQDEQRIDLAEVRADLGDTVEELVRRVDVPSRVKAKRDETVAGVKEFGQQAKEGAESRVADAREFARKAKAGAESRLLDARQVGLGAKAKAEARVPALRAVLDNPAVAAGVTAGLVVVLLIVRAVRNRSELG